MISIKVKYFAYIRSLVRGEKEESISLSKGKTLKDLLETLSERYGEKFAKAVFNNETNREGLSESIIILVNGKSVQNIDHELKDGDKVSIMPFLSGG